MGPFKRKGWQIEVCLFQPVTTVLLHRYTLQTKQLVTHKPDEQSRKTKLCMVATTTLVAVGTNSLT